MDYVYVSILLCIICITLQNNPSAQVVDEEIKDHHKRRVLIIVLLAVLTLVLLLGIVFCYYNRGKDVMRRKKLSYLYRDWNIYIFPIIYVLPFWQGL